MKTTVATIYGGLLQSYSLFNRPFKIVANTTLNEKFAIQAGVAPSSGKMPSVGYVAIGRGGHTNKTGADGEQYTMPTQHSPADGGLFKHLPFVVRALDNDLTIAEMKKYGLRKLIQSPIDNKNYYAYYLKRIDTTKSDPGMWLNTVNEDGTTSTIPFVPTSENLNPTAPVIASNQVTTSSGQYLSVATTLEMLFDANDIAEIINACKILYDNEAYAIISEIGLVSGVDQVISASSNGNASFDFTEVVAAQIVAHLTTYHNLPSSNNGLKETLDVGTTEPMLLATSLTTGAQA